jgi:hypothetical protein
VSNNDTLVQPAASILAHSSYCTVSIKSFFVQSPFQKYRGHISESIIHVITRAIKRRALYPFEEAWQIAQGHGFESKQELIDYDCAGAYQLPKNPDKVWSEEWTSWDDFLGISLDFEQGRQFLRALKLKSQDEYLKLIESKSIKDVELASRLQYWPDLKHKQEWTCLDDWLGLTAATK